MSRTCSPTNKTVVFQTVACDKDNTNLTLKPLMYDIKKMMGKM